MDNTEILDIEWHDKSLCDIHFNNLNDWIDSIEITVAYFDRGWSRTKYRTIVLSGCYAAKFELNGGVSDQDEIRSLDLVNDSEEIRSVRDRWSDWAKQGDLYHFKLETAKTGSIIDVVASSVYLKEL